ncbi:hypothetical protein [Streptomyces alanosinicus]|uniref:Uncharacterized protein n=1 Tax=Streptomyces alanosinicus TaxID=68171 RepID=A0A918YMX1_9ACTN|nr:hypothetical protein [Streptomyces alanosinicus]GHE08555.1 hypothetical protein GCM10010339_57760 [Streptomyces alanosinicus]
MMTAPIEVAIEQLVLRGIQEPDAPAVLAAFRRHLAALLADPAAPGPSVTTERPPRESEGRQSVPDSELLGRQLAFTVARVVRR